jgi:integrase
LFGGIKMGVLVKEKSKGSGVYWVFINHQGKRKSISIGIGIGNKKAALEAKKKIDAKIALGELDIQEKKKKLPIFNEYSELWLEKYIKPLRALSTYNRYKDILEKHVCPEIGKTEIDKIKRSSIKSLLMKKLGDGYSKSTACLILDVINGPLNHAIDDELISSNPLIGIMKRMDLKDNRNEKVDPLNKEETMLFLSTCMEHYPEHQPFFLTAFRTGMRLGELLALEWRDVDWNNGFIEVKRSYKLGVISKTKTGKERRVDVSDHLNACLKELHKQRKAEALKTGKDSILKILFHKEGNHIEQNFIRRVYKRVLSKAGLREIKLHGTRHTYASQLLSDGASPVYVKEQLGHSSIQMTVDVYGKWIENKDRKIVNCLDDNTGEIRQALEN